MNVEVLRLGALNLKRWTNSNKIRVFISSTFTDTKVERDLLIEMVDPLLRRLAQMVGLQYTSR